MTGAALPIAQDATGPLWTIRFASFIAFALFILATSLSLALTRGASLSGVAHGAGGPWALAAIVADLETSPAYTAGSDR